MKREGRYSSTREPKHMWFENDFLPKLAVLLVLYVEQG